MYVIVANLFEKHWQSIEQIKKKKASNKAGREEETESFKKIEIKQNPDTIHWKWKGAEEKRKIQYFNDSGCKNNQLINSVQPLYMYTVLTVAQLARWHCPCPCRFFFSMVNTEYRNIIQFERSDIEQRVESGKKRWNHIQYGESSKGKNFILH